MADLVEIFQRGAQAETQFPYLCHIHGQRVYLRGQPKDGGQNQEPGEAQKQKKQNKNVENINDDDDMYDKWDSTSPYLAPQIINLGQARDRISAATSWSYALELQKGLPRPEPRESIPPHAMVSQFVIHKRKKTRVRRENHPHLHSPPPRRQRTGIPPVTREAPPRTLRRLSTAPGLRPGTGPHARDAGNNFTTVTASASASASKKGTTTMKMTASAQQISDASHAYIPLTPTPSDLSSLSGLSISKLPTLSSLEMPLGYLEEDSGDVKPNVRGYKRGKPSPSGATPAPGRVARGPEGSESSQGGGISGPHPSLASPSASIEERKKRPVGHFPTFSDAEGARSRLQREIETAHGSNPTDSESATPGFHARLMALYWLGQQGSDTSLQEILAAYFEQKEHRMEAVSSHRALLDMQKREDGVTGVTPLPPVGVGSTHLKRQAQVKRRNAKQEMEDIAGQKWFHMGTDQAPRPISPSWVAGVKVEDGGSGPVGLGLGSGHLHYPYPSLYQHATIPEGGYVNSAYPHHHIYSPHRMYLHQHHHLHAVYPPVGTSAPGVGDTTRETGAPSSICGHPSGGSTPIATTTTNTTYLNRNPNPNPTESSTPDIAPGS